MSEKSTKINGILVFLVKPGAPRGGQPLAHSLYAAVAIPASTSIRFAFPDINSYNLSICSDITSQDWLLILKVVRAVARSRGPRCVLNLLRFEVLDGVDPPNTMKSPAKIELD